MCSIKQHLINHVTDSLIGLNEFIAETDEVLNAPLQKGDYDGLVKVLECLNGVQERTNATDEMFEPLKQTIELLKVY